MSGAKRNGWQMLCHEDEVTHIMATLNRLYAAQYGGDRTLLTAQKVRRWEAVLTALQGDVEALAQHECTC